MLPGVEESVKFFLSVGSISESVLKPFEDPGHKTLRLSRKRHCWVIFGEWKKWKVWGL